MKELSIEQKAKAYDEALERAKSKIKNDKDHVLYEDDIIEMFPALKENEDERMRRFLHHTFTAQYLCKDKLGKWHGEPVVNILAYLEKIGEQKRQMPLVKSVSTDFKDRLGTLMHYTSVDLEKEENKQLLNDAAKELLQLAYSDKANEIALASAKTWEESMVILMAANNAYRRGQKEQKSAKNIVETWKDMRLEVYQQASGNRHEPNCSDDTTKMFSLNDIDEIVEKMSEQKSTDKVEPKFHEGDWVVTDKNDTVQIKAIKDGKYVLENTMRFSIDYVDKCWRKWDISDAKSGDILYSLECNQPFIHKEKNGYKQATAYCGLNISGKFFVWGTKYCVIILSNYIPATKEQRDTLMKAMAGAGYTFDF